jgi:hypothetical protein
MNDYYRAPTPGAQPGQPLLGYSFDTLAELNAQQPAVLYRAGVLAYAADTGLVVSNGSTWGAVGSGSGGGGGLGPSIAYAPAAGTIDAAPAGFTAGLGSAGTGRINVTLAGNTTIKSLPAGVDGQQVIWLIKAGAHTLTLEEDSGSEANPNFFGSENLQGALGDALNTYYDGGLAEWVLVP